MYLETGRVAAETQTSFVAALAAQYGQRLRRFLTGRARNISDVPDLAQEVFLRLMRVEQHAVIRSPEAYLFTVASHVVHQYNLRERNAPQAIEISELLTELQLTSDDDPSASVETQERLKNLQRVLDELPPKYTATLLLHKFAGLSIEEIGKRLGVARPTAKKYLAQALIHCRNARTDRK